MDVREDTPVGAAPPDVFVPEAHRPRGERLVVDALGVAVEEVGALRYRVAWSECGRVLVLPDRVELVTPVGAALVLHAHDWYRGEGLGAAVRRHAPPGLVAAVHGAPEPDPTPYRLGGLALAPTSVLVTLVAGLPVVGLVGVQAGLADDRGRAVALGLLFLLPVPVLVHALVRRLLVPPRWRDAARVASRVTVLGDDVAARSRTGALAVAGVLAAGAVGLVLLEVVLTVSRVAYLWRTGGLVGVVAAVLLLLLAWGLGGRSRG